VVVVVVVELVVVVVVGVAKMDKLAPTEQQCFPWEDSVIRNVSSDSSSISVQSMPSTRARRYPTTYMSG